MATIKKKSKTGTNGNNHRRTTRKHSNPGIYTVPRGHVSIAVPAFWTLRQTNEDLEIEAPSGTTSVIVTAFKHDKNSGKPDAREFLTRFLQTAPHNGRTRIDKGTRQKASARFRDPDGDNWHVKFVSNGRTLLLATCNTSGPMTSREGKTGIEVLDSLKLKARE